MVASLGIVSISGCGANNQIAANAVMSWFDAGPVYEGKLAYAKHWRELLMEYQLDQQRSFRGENSALLWIGLSSDVSSSETLNSQQELIALITTVKYVGPDLYSAPSKAWREEEDAAVILAWKNMYSVSVLAREFKKAKDESRMKSEISLFSFSNDVRSDYLDGIYKSFNDIHKIMGLNSIDKKSFYSLLEKLAGQEQYFKSLYERAELGYFHRREKELDSRTRIISLKIDISPKSNAEKRLQQQLNRLDFTATALYSSNGNLQRYREVTLYGKPVDIYIERDIKKLVEKCNEMTVYTNNRKVSERCIDRLGSSISGWGMTAKMPQITIKKWKQADYDSYNSGMLRYSHWAGKAKELSGI